MVTRGEAEDHVRSSTGSPWGRCALHFPLPLPPGLMPALGCTADGPHGLAPGQLLLKHTGRETVPFVYPSKEPVSPKGMNLEASSQGTLT